jgi:hypothetical protein
VNRLVVGSHVIVYINGQIYARVADFSYAMATPQKLVHGIDTLLPIETIPTSAEVKGTMSIYRTHGDGGIEARGMIATWDDLTRGKYFTIDVVDRASDTSMFRADRCVVQDQSWRVARGFVMGQISFSALNWSNETAPVGK